MQESTRDQQETEIPDRLFFKIGDVSELTGVESHVLRFWETEFPSLSPRKTSSGQRQYRRKDIETVLAIKSLLYNEGYTIAGARKALRGKRKGAAEAATDEDAPAVETTAVTPGPSAVSPSALQEIRAKLEQILQLLAP